MQGTVKWFNASKHFGFIHSDEDGKDYFVHNSSLPEGTVLNEGQKVSFEPETNDKGPIASNIVLE